MFCRRLPDLASQLTAQLSVAVALLICLATSGLAKGATAAPRFVTIPVYYLTDREKLGDKYGNRRRYKSECKHHMYYGTAQVTVPNTDHKIIDDKLKALGWQSSQRSGGKISPKDTIDPTHPFKAKMVFLGRLAHALKEESSAAATIISGAVPAPPLSSTATSTSAAAAPSTPTSTSPATDSSTPIATTPVMTTSISTSTAASVPSSPSSTTPPPEPQLCLFVHGAADAFEDCAEDAATLAYYLEKPIVLYSWPSDPHLRGYFIDGTNIEWSQKHFGMFCRDLLELKTEHPMDVICLSHSMGNRLVIRALPVVYGKGLISDWEMISPDIDADTCRHYLMGYKQTRAKIRLYVSNKDLILPFTQMINGGYYRLGEAANPAWERKKRIRAEYLERIDFTAIDKGWYGHSLPFKLVADMVRTDRPPKGYALVPERSVHANGLARFAGRSESLAATSSEADFCSRLVKDKSGK